MHEQRTGHVQFSNTNSSQGSVATRLSMDGSLMIALQCKFPVGCASEGILETDQVFLNHGVYIQSASGYLSCFI